MSVGIHNRCESCESFLQGDRMQCSRCGDVNKFRLWNAARNAVEFAHNFPVFPYRQVLVRCVDCRGEFRFWAVQVGATNLDAIHGRCPLCGSQRPTEYDKFPASGTRDPSAAYEVLISEPAKQAEAPTLCSSNVCDQSFSCRTLLVDAETACRRCGTVNQDRAQGLGAGVPDEQR
jgi:hypothetical protein